MYYNCGRNCSDDRFFPAAPFLLGALTGGVAVAAFNPYRPRPYYPVGPVYGPVYGPMYGPGFGPGFGPRPW